MQIAGHVNKLGYIVMVKFKILQLKQVLDVAHVAGDQVIHAYHVEIFLNKPVAQMRA
jgi:hypothetical protein